MALSAIAGTRVIAITNDRQVQLNANPTAVLTANSATATGTKVTFLASSHTTGTLDYSVNRRSLTVADVTGISYKQINQGVIELKTNIKTFGDMQVDEAARIVGALQQLGMSYQSFGSMVNKYMSFEQAASSISDLTSVFGVHLDAMEMMRLANEDEEEFMHRMRDSFIEQGIAVDDLSKAQRNMLASTLGIDASEVENFFDPDLMEASLEDMESATDKADLSKGFEEAATSAERFTRTMADAEKIVNDRMFAGGRQALYEMLYGGWDVLYDILYGGRDVLCDILHGGLYILCLLYTSPSPRDLST